MAATKQMTALAGECDTLLAPATAGAMVGHGPGLIAHLTDLKNALLSGDMDAIFFTARQVLDCIFGVQMMSAADAGSQLARVKGEVAAAGIDWARLLDVIMKILSLFRSTP